MIPVPCTIGSQIVLGPLDPKPLENLRKDLSFRNPEYTKLRRLKKLTDDVKESIDVLVELPCGGGIAPRGTWDLVKKSLKEVGYRPVVHQDLRALGAPLVTRATVADLTLRDYQQRGVDQLLERLQGIVVLPCGCGKTRLGVAAILAAGRTAIILVHTDDLADQWMELLLEIGVDAGRVDGDHDDHDKPVVVAMIASLRNKLKDPFEDTDWLSNFGTCVLDEAHHAPARTFMMVLNAIPARYRLGLTATPDREDGLERLMNWSFGPRLLERNTEEMIKLGFLMKAEIELVHTAFEFEWSGPDEKKIAAMDKAIVKDDARNQLIIDRAVAEAKAGETVLVLYNRKAHCKTLAKKICALGVEAVAVNSATKKSDRKGTIQALRDGKLPIMIATSLADEGLDVRRLSRILLAWPQRARGGTTQRTGRLLRDFAKKPKLIDFVDSRVATLADRASDRRSVWREMGLMPRWGEKVETTLPLPLPPVDPFEI